MSCIVPNGQILFKIQWFSIRKCPIWHWLQVASPIKSYVVLIQEEILLCAKGFSVSVIKKEVERTKFVLETANEVTLFIVE